MNLLRSNENSYFGLVDKFLFGLYGHLHVVYIFQWLLYIDNHIRLSENSDLFSITQIMPVDKVSGKVQECSTAIIVIGLPLGTIGIKIVSYVTRKSLQAIYKH